MTQSTTGYRRLFTPELVAILIVCCTAFFAGEILSPILPLYLSSLGLDASKIGLMFSIMMVGIAISEVFWGWVVDRVDLKLAIFMGTVIYGVIISAFNFARVGPQLVLVIFIYGFCRSPLFIVGRWFLGVYAPNDMKAFAVALLFTASGIVETIGGFASGYITQTWGYGFTFWLSAGLAVSAGIGILIAGRRLNFQKHKQTKKVPGAGTEKPFSVRREDKMLTVFLGIIGACYFICFGIYSTYLPLYASQVVQVNTSQIGSLFGVKSLATTLTLIPLGGLADRKGIRFFMPIGMGIIAVSMASIAFSSSYAFLFISTILFALGTAVYHPIGTAILSQIIPVHWTGTAMGIYGLLEDVGWMIGPLIGGVLWETWGQQAPFLLAGLIALISIPPLLLWRHGTSSSPIPSLL